MCHETDRHFELIRGCGEMLEAVATADPALLRHLRGSLVSVAIDGIREIVDQPLRQSSSAAADNDRGQ